MMIIIITIDEVGVTSIYQANNHIKTYYYGSFLSKKMMLTISGLEYFYFRHQ
ncbi:hypothetical protein [Proteus faecis]|uniref:Uncharacterized protein n=1 Tax=Proteus faecis TaxID=2050967 RepID=A0AAW7CGX8_9GAMM|nr:hypothetical protein [Proteus faecis]MBG3011862.1 hypothetical protein [Proteus mirabilis]MDO5404707.1 hypothetical protein [Proteus sp. (in: enterobacteria)]MDL5165488.1 hypothetical protein [Proteus faecis]MDL5274248.1 hypothetical protein [Proteus faecis]MDL5277818.1 hypothetical protein [Proteus faecis]